MTVEVRDEFGNPVTSGAVTVNLASDSAGTHHFYTEGTTTRITSIVVADGSSSARFDYSDERAGAPTVTGAATGLTSATQQQTINAPAADRITLTASETTLASEGKGSATLMATLQDQFGNTVATKDVTINLLISDDTYVILNNASPTTDASGEATATITTKAGKIADPPQNTIVTAQSAGLTDSAPVTFSLVNFSIQVDSPGVPFTEAAGVNLVTSESAPSSATFTGIGGTSGQYQWALSSVGSLSGTATVTEVTKDTVSFYAPATIEGYSKTDTLTLTSAKVGDEQLKDEIKINIYNPLRITDPAASICLTTRASYDGTTEAGSPTTYTLGVTGGTDQYTGTVSAAGLMVSNEGVIDASTAGTGTYTVTVIDAAHGDVNVDNGFRAVTPNIVVVDPIEINPAAKTQFQSAAGAYTGYTARGGSNSGTYVWTSSNAAAGTIDGAAGVFTPAMVATGSETTTIRATDPTYGTIYAEIEVTVFAGLSLSQPSNYDDADPSTYPILAGAGAVYTVTVSHGTGGAYTWRILDATGAEVVSPTDGGASFGVDADTLFANGAGVYTVEVADANGDFDKATIRVAIPMRIADFAGSWKSTDSGIAFTVTGHPNPFTWTMTNEAGILIADGAYGRYTGTNRATNFFQFDAAKINEPITLRALAQSDDLALKNAGLDKVISGPHVVVPVPVFNIVILGSDAPDGVGGAVITATHDASFTATSAGDGTASIKGLINSGVTYNFTVEAAGYMSTLFSVTDIGKTKTVTLEKITRAGTISGTVTPAGAGITVKVMKGDGTFIQNESGATLQTLADAATGDYTLTFETAAGANAGPYTVHAYRSGYVTNLEDNAGVVGAAVNTAGNDITLVQITTITITDDGGTPNVSFSVTANPAFTEVPPTEIQVFEGTSDAGNDVTAGLGYAGGKYTHTLSVPAQGATASIFVKADTSTSGRDASSGYHTSRTVTVVAVAKAYSETTIHNPNTAGGTAQSTSGDTEVNLPAGGLVGEVIPQVTVAISEANALGAAGGGSIITGSDIVEVDLIDPNTGMAIGGDAINKIYITITFDPTKVPVGSLESGSMVIYQAVNMASMVEGNASPLPASQILLPVDYTNGNATFWVTGLSAFGIGSSTAGTTDSVLEGGGGSCFVATAAFGSPFERHVEILRKFRDAYLMPSRLGQRFVEVYYRLSPPVAAFIAERDGLRAAVRVLLLPAVGLGFAVLQMGAALPLISLAGLMAAVLVVVRRRRGCAG
jgi:hypothetical protein